VYLAFPYLPGTTHPNQLLLHWVYLSSLGFSIFAGRRFEDPASPDQESRGLLLI
jgi:hypothetical protein